MDAVAGAVGISVGEVVACAAGFPVPEEGIATGQNHHDLAVLAVGANALPAPPDSVGLYHVALKIGDNLDDLKRAKAHLEAHGITRIRVSDHRVSQSIYLNDPDGNGLELFVDADPAIWHNDPAAVAHVEPLEL